MAPIDGVLDSLVGGTMFFWVVLTKDGVTGVGVAGSLELHDLRALASDDGISATTHHHHCRQTQIRPLRQGDRPSLWDWHPANDRGLFLSRT